MQYGVLGTGIVGQTLGSRLIELGHDVKMGSRTAGGDIATNWVASNGQHASEGTFADAAVFGELIINATAGSAATEVANLAGPQNVGSKIVIDVSNPLDASNGFPPSLTVCNTDSVGEQLQRMLPMARVVKTLNTVNCAVMVAPGRFPQSHNVFINSDYTSAKGEVRVLLNSLGWMDDDIIDLGDITASRATEAYMMLWTRMFQSLATPDFNIRVVRG